MPTRTRRRWPWIALGVLLLLLIPVGILLVPMLFHQDGGQSTPIDSAEEWPTTVAAIGDDGRTRTLQVHSPDPGGVIDPAAIRPGDRIVVSGVGYDAGQGIYVAICRIPESPAEKPGPCLGGVPEATQDSGDTEPGVIEYAPSNWINDDWAWKLFGARGYDDAQTGSFTAYLQVPPASDDAVDCTTERCAIFTRNDHTALGDRVQDVYLPVRFVN